MREGSDGGTPKGLSGALAPLGCFDTVEDPFRPRVVKVLKEYGRRVQKSVFECPNLTEQRYLKLKGRPEELIDETEDTVRDYLLCRACLQKVEISGAGVAQEAQAYKVMG